MLNNIQWQCLFFDQLTTKQLYAILAARSEVFIVEQNCIYQDIDNIDLVCHHVIAWTEQGELAAYLRIVPPGQIFTEASIGRVITSKFARGTGIGKQLLVRGIEETQKIYPQDGLKIAAQQYLEKFYEGFGFKTVSDMYLEDGIPHVEMILE
jgi:ElaA protein